MTREEITLELARLLEKHINPSCDPRIYCAREVTFDYATPHAVRVDYMRFKPENNSVSGIERGLFYCYEIKSSADDYRSKNGHNFLGDYNYYVMPYDVYEKLDLSQGAERNIGVLCSGDWEGLRAVRKATKVTRARSVAEMLFMMYRSSNRDRLKYEMR